MTTRRRLFATTVYVDADQLEKLDRLREVTRVSTARRIRQAVDLILKKHAADLPRNPPGHAG